MTLNSDLEKSGSSLVDLFCGSCGSVIASKQVPLSMLRKLVIDHAKVCSGGDVSGEKSGRLASPGDISGAQDDYVASFF